MARGFTADAELPTFPPDADADVTSADGVAIALPGEEGRVTKGDLLLDALARYVLIRPIPLDTPPEMVAADPYGPPPGAPPSDSPPHVARRMVHVFEVAG